MPFDLTIVIPAHNEASRLATGFARLEPVIRSLGDDGVEVLVVDDGSSDDTGKIAAGIYRALPHYFVVRQETNRGKGAAVRLGISVAQGSRVAVLDADMAIDARHLPELLHALDQFDVAAGSRALSGSIPYESRLRTYAGAAFNALVRQRTGTQLRDTQCGFKGFQIGAARLLACVGLVEGFAYDVELLFLAERLGLTVAAVPVTWDDVEGSSVRLVRDSRRMLRDIRRLRRNDYDCPSVRASSNVDLEEVRAASRSARKQGLVIARGDVDSLIVLPRDGAIAGLAIANAVGGSLGLATLDELRGRELVAV